MKVMESIMRYFGFGKVAEVREPVAPPPPHTHEVDDLQKKIQDAAKAHAAVTHRLTGVSMDQVELTLHNSETIRKATRDSLRAAEAALQLNRERENKR